MPVISMKSLPAGALVLVLTGLVSFAAAAPEALPKPPETPKLTEAARRGWLRVRIVSGRIVFSGTRLGTINDAAKTGEREERVGIRIAGQELTVNYEMLDSDEEFRLEVTGAGQIHVRRTPRGDSSLVPVDFTQSPDEPLRLAVGADEGQRVHQAPSLWHLFLLQPEACRRHLVPMLDVLGQQWDLGGTAGEVEAALVRAAAEGELPDPRRWAALIEQLGDEQFSRREAADRELRALGRVVYTYLQQLDTSRLDAEQHYRVRRIIMTLEAGMENDAPSEIASWLAGDPTVWLAILSRDDESTRRLAAKRLEVLLGEPIPFDPAADAAARAEQVEKLRLRISERR